MRQFTLVVASIVALATLLSACGTKGPLTLPPKPAATQTAEPAKATTPATAPTVDPNTGAGQH
jgi:predicted small lipoprotein YifL